MIQSKPSEKGEIITYLSQMGDVLDDISEWGEIIIRCAVRIDTIIDCNEANIQLRESDFRIHAHLQVVTAKSRHILDNDPFY